MDARVVGIVIGSRKCGTTWLYENFRRDPDICVSRKVKESGFFGRANDLDFRHYENLFPKSQGKRVEVDSSLAYSEVSPGKILGYNPEMKIVLILRDPIEYTVSRYLHLMRKGQVSTASISDIVMNDNVLSRELDYASMLARFEAFRRLGNMLIVPYGLLATDATRFYRTIKAHLIGPTNDGYEPKHDRVNVSRASKWSLMTRMLSGAASAARKRNLHSVVNFAKSLRAHKLLEKQVESRQIAALRESVSGALAASHQTSLDLYLQIEKQFVADLR